MSDTDQIDSYTTLDGDGVVSVVDDGVEDGLDEFPSPGRTRGQAVIIPPLPTMTTRTNQEQRVDDRGLRTSSLRSIYWRLFLGELDRLNLENWYENLMIKRGDYEQLCAKYRLKLATPTRNDEDEQQRQASEKAASDLAAASLAKAEEDLRKHNPLSNSKENPWQQHFDDTELSETIRHDLNRTHSDNEFFTHHLIQEMMFNILFLWSKEIGTEKEGRYRQGMNEILAPIVLVFMRESQDLDSWAANPSSSNNDDTTATPTPTPTTVPIPTTDGVVSSSTIPPNDALLAHILDRTKVEHDCYALFCAIMHQIGQYFIKVDTQPNSKELLAKKRAAVLAGEPIPPTVDTLSDQTPILRKCTYIHHILLSTLDPQLYSHLIAMDVQPNLYLLRWYRLMLCREFHLEDTLLVWDVIFATMERGDSVPSIVGVASTKVATLSNTTTATGNSSSSTSVSTSVSASANSNEPLPLHSNAFVLTEYMCISMLLYVRTALLHGDNVFCLRRLLRYPPVEDVRVLLGRALHFLNSWKLITSDPNLTRDVFDPTLISEHERMNSAFDGPWHTLTEEGMGVDAPLEDHTRHQHHQRPSKSVRSGGPTSTPFFSPSHGSASSSSSSSTSTSTATSAKTLFADGFSSLKSFVKGAVAKAGELPHSTARGGSATAAYANTAAGANNAAGAGGNGTKKHHAPSHSSTSVDAPNRKLPHASGVSHFLTPAGLHKDPPTHSHPSSTSSKSSSHVASAPSLAPPSDAQHDELVLLRKQVRLAETQRNESYEAINLLKTQLKDQEQINHNLGELVGLIVSEMEGEWERTFDGATKQTQRSTSRKVSTQVVIESSSSEQTMTTKEETTIDQSSPAAPSSQQQFSEDLLLGSLAELKHIKDVLVGRLTLADVVDHLSLTVESELLSPSSSPSPESSPDSNPDSSSSPSTIVEPAPIRVSRVKLLRDFSAIHARRGGVGGTSNTPAIDLESFPYNLPTKVANGGKKFAPLFEPELKQRDKVRELFELDESDALPGVYPKIDSRSVQEKEKSSALVASSPSPSPSSSPSTSTSASTSTPAPSSSPSLPVSTILDPLLSPGPTSSQSPTNNTHAHSTTTAATTTTTPAVDTPSNALLSSLLSPSPPPASATASTSGVASSSTATTSVSSLFDDGPSSPFGPTAASSRLKSSVFSPVFDLEEEDSSILLPTSDAFKSAKTTKTTNSASTNKTNTNITKTTTTTTTRTFKDPLFAADEEDDWFLKK